MEALTLPEPRPTIGGLSTAQRAVLSWLQKHKPFIVGAEAFWRVSRHAIAAAIAWEALHNVRWTPVDNIGRSAGPGKVHYSANRTFGEGNPIAEQVEVAGYLPRRTMEARQKILRKAVNDSGMGAIDYIGAIMAAIADVVGKHGSGRNIRCDSLILTNQYQGIRGDTLEAWEQQVKQKPPGQGFLPGNPMALWLQDAANLAFIQTGVGSYDGSICTPAYVGPPAPDRILSRPPVNKAPPVVSGPVALGRTVTASPGSWVGNPPPTFSYQWRRS